MDFESLQKVMKENGIVGAGGAGFPSYAKLNKSCDTIILNCAECEPLLRLHRQLLERRTNEILQTLETVADTLGINNVIVGIKEVYTKTVQSLNRCIPNFKKISLCLLPEIYPAGDEVVLTYQATGRIVPPGKIPAMVGVIVYNVETMYNLYHALKGIPVTHKFVTVTGEVAHPTTFYAPIGSELYGLIKRSGGVTVDDPQILLGGPMMGNLTHDMDVVTKTTNAIIVLSKNHPVVLRKQTRVGIDVKRAMASCCQCHYCTDMCPRHLLGHPIDPSEIMRVVSNNDGKYPLPFLNSFYCSGCGVCEAFACQQGLSPRNVIGEIKKQLRANGIKPREVTEPIIAKEDRALKLVPLKRLRSRLSLDEYNNPAPLYEEPINAKEVMIKISQNIGVAPLPCVQIGDYVKEGQLIAKAPDDKLSVNLHASIDGTVKEITDRYILIRR